jgi:hypothetical protein
MYMKKYFCLILSSALFAQGYDLTKSAQNFCKIAFSAGPNLTEAAYYFSLLYNKPVIINSDTKHIFDHIAYIKNIITKYNTELSETIIIDYIPERLCKFVHEPLVAAAHAIRINKKLFDYLSDQEKEAAVVHALVKIEKRHILTHACALTAIPFITESILKSNRYILSKMHTDSTSLISIRDLLDRVSRSCFTKLSLNFLLTNWYLKKQAQNYDRAALQKLKKGDALAALYTKMHTLIKDTSYVLSLRQPSLASRKHYLSQ